MNKKNITNQDVHKINRNTVLKFIFEKGCTSRQEISAALRMSMPTGLQSINELLSLGIICEGGQYESTGGRKAAVVQAVPDHRYALGVDITLDHV